MKVVGFAGFSGSGKTTLVERLIPAVRGSVAEIQLSAALRDVWDVISATNRYIVTREPWKLARLRRTGNRSGTSGWSRRSASASAYSSSTSPV